MNDSHVDKLAALDLEEIQKERAVYEQVPGMPEEHMILNFGPQHPATHGTLHMVLELDGERVAKATPHLGYLHTGFEKLGEYRSYNQFITLTDRMNYLSPLSNNIGYSHAVEKLMGIEITPRCRNIRLHLPNYRDLQIIFCVLVLPRLTLKRLQLFCMDFELEKSFMIYLKLLLELA